MIKIRDAGELQRVLDEDFGWRVQEIYNAQQIASKLKNASKSTIMRASVPLLYAHYEGFIKTAAVAYASFISNLGLKFAELKDCMRGVKAMQKVHQINNITKKFSAAGSILNELILISEEKATISLHEHIAEVGNLDFDTLCQILDLLHLNSNYYNNRRIFIEETLLFNRNGIAHGDRYPIDQATFDSIHLGVLHIIRCFKTDIENAVSMKTYLAS